MPTDELSTLDLLTAATLDVEGRMPWSSNATFLVHLRHDGREVGKAIYKPLRGERPLWDFPEGLYRREVAAFALSEAMGLGIVPPTVVREDGPYGLGSVQWFVDADHRQHYFTIYETRPELHAALHAFAVFDVVANNTDRKSGHVLIDGHDRLWGIDHGLCFAEEFKLRTVVWEFAGEPIPDHLLDAVRAVASDTPTAVTSLLAPEEVAAMQDRATFLLDRRVFPSDPSGRRFPWPLV